MKIPLEQLRLLLAAAAAAHLILPATAAEVEEGGVEEQQQAMTHPGCPGKCGNISIPFPFGMGKPECFLPGFEVTCNTSSSRRPRLFLVYNESGPVQWTDAMNHTATNAGVRHRVKSNAVELMDISVAENEARAYSALSSDCSRDGTNFLSKLRYTILGNDGPFLLSVTRNALIGVGSNVESMVRTSFGETGNEKKAYMPSCLSNLVWSLQYATDGTCSGLGCCQVALPPNTSPLTTFGVVFMPRSNSLWKTNPCFYGMLVEKSWYNFSRDDLEGWEELYPGGVPVVLNFAIRNLGSCPREGEGQPQPPGYACVSGNSTCENAPRGAYVCKCLEHY